MWTALWFIHSVSFQRWIDIKISSNEMNFCSYKPIWLITWTFMYYWFVWWTKYIFKWHFQFFPHKGYYKLCTNQCECVSTENLSNHESHLFNAIWFIHKKLYIIQLKRPCLKFTRAYFCHWILICLFIPYFVLPWKYGLE